jgi:hypothetical protein
VWRPITWPWLMMAVLAVLTVESVLANRFHRRSAPDAEAGAKAGEPVDRGQGTITGEGGMR